MTALDANPDNTSPAAVPEAPAPVVGPMAGDPAMLGLGSFIVGSVALGLAIVGVVPAGVLGAPLAIILAATALGLLLAAVWAAGLKKRARRAPKLLAATVDHGLRPEAKREAAGTK